MYRPEGSALNSTAPRHDAGVARNLRSLLECRQQHAVRAGKDLARRGSDLHKWEFCIRCNSRGLLADNGPLRQAAERRDPRLLTSRQSSSTNVHERSAPRPDDEAAAYGRYAGVPSQAP